MRRSGLKKANPIARPLVTRGVPGATAASALGVGAGLSSAYWLHRTSLQGGAHYGAHDTLPERAL
jgi:hypothetical protein